MTETKKCCRCKQTKDVSEFYLNKSRKDGLAYDCKACRAKYYEEHREERAEQSSAYYYAHQEEQKKRGTQYYYANRAKILAKADAFRRAAGMKQYKKRSKP